VIRAPMQERLPLPQSMSRREGLVQDPTPSPSRWRRGWSVAFASLEAVVVVVVAAVALNLRRYDLRVPIDYWGDTLWFTVLVKGMIQNGWTFEIPQLSAPYGLSAVAFPCMTAFDWGVMKVITLFSKEVLPALLEQDSISSFQTDRILLQFNKAAVNSRLSRIGLRRSDAKRRMERKA